MLSGLDHPNIVNLKGFCASPLRIVMEYISHGSLFHYLENKDNSVTHMMRLKISQDVARGMNFLHTLTPPVIHRGTFFFLFLLLS